MVISASAGPGAPARHRLVIALAISDVARAAAVHKTTIYRRWPIKEHLLLDALPDYGETEIALPTRDQSRET